MEQDKSTGKEQALSSWGELWKSKHIDYFDNFNFDGLDAFVEGMKMHIK